MNYPMLRYLFGMILLIEAAFLALPLGVAVIYGESTGIYFLYTMAAAGLLGFLLTGTFCYARRFTIFKPMFFSLLAAVCDESIKIFVIDRTAQLSDVWLDGAGALTGILLMWLISAIKKR